MLHRIMHIAHCIMLHCIMHTHSVGHVCSRVKYASAVTMMPMMMLPLTFLQVAAM
jgi:hypothetical protein